MNQHTTPHAWDAGDNKPVIPKIPGPRAPHASELAAAIRVAQQMLASDDVLKVREALRLLLRSLDAEPLTEDEAAQRFVDRHFPETAAFLASERSGQ